MSSSNIWYNCYGHFCLEYLNKQYRHNNKQQTNMVIADDYIVSVKARSQQNIITHFVFLCMLTIKRLINILLFLLLRNYYFR